MKISSGILQGLKTSTPNSTNTRPTLSKIRGAVFSMLGDDLDSKVFWDLFAGSGVMGLTAISLGARECCFVEIDRSACKHLKDNIREAQRRLKAQALSARIKFFSEDLAVVWSQMSSWGLKPDYIWADPPYQDTLKWLKFLLASLTLVVRKDGLFILEAATKDLSKIKNLFNLNAYWDIFKIKSYGEVSIVIGRQDESISDESGNGSLRR